MKRVIIFSILASIVLLVSSSTVKKSSKYVSIPDKNFRAYLLSNFDNNNDGNISSKEAKLVTKIKCENSSIKSLLGIERFVNLTTLDCQYNQLTSFDITNNRKLTELYCGSNLLTSLYISKNTKLPNYKIKSY